MGVHWVGKVINLIPVVFSNHGLHKFAKVLIHVGCHDEGLFGSVKHQHAALHVKMITAPSTQHLACKVTHVACHWLEKRAMFPKCNIQGV
jgi:hypothetical protein